MNIDFSFSCYDIISVSVKIEVADTFLKSLKRAIRVYLVQVL